MNQQARTGISFGAALGRITKHCCSALATLVAAVGFSTPALAHPHVFIDGGVDFRFGPDRQLEALEITWIYDPFETLYMLAENEMMLNADGGLDEADRQELQRRLAEFPPDFDGSAHLGAGGAMQVLAWPENTRVDVVDGRLHMRFTRRLETPISAVGDAVDVAFYESTYFFDFSLTEAPKLIGAAEGCTAKVALFDPNSQDRALLDVLAKLSREETSDIENVGSYFADRISVTCD
ncbi:hypothetical protein TRP8649_04202 [Pelagimonas phthalicica]|uniref:Polyphosphate kinase n=1 Tax=Pelagimonas phthalicica TaxID=1037362 RepID=A0A238JJF8_9RHOB|nr:ABC-type uncharacterized transport system substrate-binding protein [Pelagimonas phthalicica]SMX30062.1 hypothetical protein TRP8649_04202 [Pelagimonas phthalicica]